MDEKEIERYIITNKTVSIPEIQKEFDLGYKEVHLFISKLLEEEKISLMDELHYQYCKKTEDIPPLYLKILWECIELDEVDTSYLQRKYDLSTPTIKTILKWMTNNEFISNSPFPNVQITEQGFIERFGPIERHLDEDDDLEDKEEDPFKRDAQIHLEGLREALGLKREELKKRISQFDAEVDELEESKEDFWERFFATKKTDNSVVNATALHEKVLKENMREVMELMPNMTHAEYVELINFRFADAKTHNAELANIYEEILNLTRGLSEENFQNLRKKVLE